MATGDVPSHDLSFSLSQLADSSHLKKLLQDQAPQLNFAAEAAEHWNNPIGQCPAGMKLDFSFSHGANWKTSTGICFGLTGSAECCLEIVSSGAVLSYLDGVDSTAKASMPSGSYPGAVYVKLSLSFNISGKISGAGKVGALGISGNAKASAGTNFVFAHRAAAGVLLKDAIGEALNSFVFPFEPNCSLQIPAGDLAQVTFSGCLSYGLELSYGLGSYSFTAPSVTNTLESCTKGMASLTMPSVSVDIGADFNLGLTHSDDFTAIVEKLDAKDAFLYLMRAHKNEVTVDASLGAQVTVDAMPTVKLDQAKFLAGLNHVTRGQAGKQAASVCSTLEGKLNDKVNDWVSGYVKDGAQLKAAWDAQNNTTLISKYKVAIDNPVLLGHSWDYFCQGNITSAVGAGGLLLQPGSGVSQDIERKLTISVTFFNFFHAQNAASYFQQSKTYVTDTGDLRFLFDVGKESDTEVSKALQKARIHFVADAAANTSADVKLQVELSETHNKVEAVRMALIASYLPVGRRPQRPQPT